MANGVKKVIAGIAALAALAFGGAAIANAGNGSGDQGPPSAIAVNEAPAAESAAPENSALDPDNVQDESGQDKGEKGEAAEANEPPEASEQSEGPEAEGSEVPNDDEPGGHADEPRNPNADHQFEGKE